MGRGHAHTSNNPLVLPPARSVVSCVFNLLLLYDLCVVNVICSKDCIWLALGQQTRKNQNPFEDRLSLQATSKGLKCWMRGGSILFLELWPSSLLSRQEENFG